MDLIERFTIEGDTLYFGRSNERHGYNLGQLTDRSFNALSILNKHADELERLTAELKATQENEQRLVDANKPVLADKYRLQARVETLESEARWRANGAFLDKPDPALIATEQVDND